MIGLSRLTDGGHVLEHPAGPLYVEVRAEKIERAELAAWGEARLLTWPHPPRPLYADLWRRLFENAIGGGDAAAQV